MSKINSYCIVCGEGYHCCISCPEQRASSWRLIADTDNHFKIYLIVCEYRDKKITKQEAKKQLEKVDITGWQKFKNKGTKKLMSEILSEDKKDVLDKKDTIKIKNKKVVEVKNTTELEETIGYNKE